MVYGGVKSASFARGPILCVILLGIMFLARMNTITFRDCDGKKPKEVVFLTKLENKPNGIELEFNKGIDERSRGPRRYSVTLVPAAGIGTWRNAEDEGDLEKVVQKNLGKEITVSGIWPEAGERLTFEVYFLE